MSTYIDYGGHGFRQSALMNVASCSLAKYGNKNSFLDLEARPNISWTMTWKNILVGRDVVVKGIDMQIWSGEPIWFTSSSNQNMSCSFLPECGMIQ